MTLTVCSFHHVKGDNMAEVYAEDILKASGVVKENVQPTQDNSVYIEDILSSPVESVSPTVSETPKYIEQTITDRIGKIIDKRSGNIEKAFKAMSPKELQTRFGSSYGAEVDASDFAKIALAQSAGAFMDVTGELIVSGISAVIPDDIEDSVKQSFVDGLNYVASTDVGSKLAGLASEGMEDYMEWRKNNPVAALKIESVVDLATFFAPPAARKALRPAVLAPEPAITKLGEAAAEQVDNIANYFKNTAKLQINKAKAEKAYEFVMPVHLKENRLKDVQGRSFFKDAKLNPSPLEAEAIEYVSKLNIDTSKGFKAGWDVIEKAKKEEGIKLRALLASRARNTVIPKELTKSRINSVVVDLTANTPELVGETRQIFDRVIKQLDTLVDSHGTTPNDILTLRQDFDNFLDNKMKFFEKEQIAGLDTSVRTVRRELNNILNDVIGDDAVKESLRRSELAFTASKGVAPKAVKEIDREATLLYKNLGRVLGNNVRMSRVLAYSTLGASGFASFMGVLPYMTGAAFTIGLGTMAYKGAVSPTAKKSLAATLEEISKAMRVTTNKETLQELRAGRSLVLEMLKLPVEEEQAVEPEPQQ